MIGRYDIDDQERTWGLHEDVVEKDCVFGWDWGVVPGDEPGGRPARGGRHPQAGHGRTAKPCFRGPRAHRGVRGASGLPLSPAPSSVQEFYCSTR